MPEFEIVEVRVCEPYEWLDSWAAKYDDLAGYDEDEYNRLIGLAQQDNLCREYFVRIGRWKDSANTVGRWQPNVASVAYIIWLQAEAERPNRPAEEEAVNFLDAWSSRTYEDVFLANRVNKRFGLSRATTLLHFLSGGRFPIYDSNVIEAMRRLYGVRPTYTAHYYWNTFYPQFRELAATCNTEDFRRLDKALFSYGATKLFRRVAHS
jgi:hypothetical protein